MIRTMLGSFFISSFMIWAGFFAGIQFFEGNKVSAIILLISALMMFGVNCAIMLKIAGAGE